MFAEAKGLLQLATRFVLLLATIKRKYRAHVAHAVAPAAVIAIMAKEIMIGSLVGNLL